MMTSFGMSNTVFAEEYDFVAGIHSEVTFHFRDGVETHEFPVFKMTSDFVTNAGTTFNVQGVVEEAPHLHKALDESYKYRMMFSTGGSSFEYGYKFSHHIYPDTSIFYALYFLMTGLHMLHVFIGLIILIVIAVLAQKGKFTKEYYTPVEVGGLYWHLVDLIWIYLFPLLYLVG